MAGSRRTTQRDIARMTGVSQATVSLVLNGRAKDDVRIAPATRERVLRAIRETGYVADPVARRLAARHNRIFGVFTYEPVFPIDTADFYHPFLVGIEECAERLGLDLLLLTSAPVVDGRRRIFHQGNPLRLADGCILLGRSLDRSELTRLVAEGQPFVSVGRRADAGGPVPYVGADYRTATAALATRALRLGHTRLAFVGHHEVTAGQPVPESQADRECGLSDAAGVAGAYARSVSAAGLDAGELLDALLADGITAVFVDDYADGVGMVEAARRRGLTVPGDLSVVALGDAVRPVDRTEQFTGFRIPRRRMGWEAVDALTELLQGGVATPQRLLPCELVEGRTLAPPRGE